MLKIKNFKEKLNAKVKKNKDMKISMKVIEFKIFN
jgi:hypothetical protein